MEELRITPARETLLNLSKGCIHDRVICQWPSLIAIVRIILPTRISATGDMNVMRTIRKVGYSIEAVIVRSSNSFELQKIKLGG